MNIATVVVYLLVMLSIGAINARRAGSAAGFYLAGRRGGPLLLAASLLATILGASATLGMAANGYRDGLVAAWWLLPGAAGLVLAALLLAAPLQRLGVFTLPEVLGRQYGPRVRSAASVLVAVAWLGVIAAQIVGVGTVMSLVAGGATRAWMIASALVLIAYVALGGQLAVLRTDAWQLVLLLAGLAAGLVGGLAAVGGFHGLSAGLPAEMLRFPVNQEMPPARVMTWLLAVGLPYAAGPDMVSRLLCARDEPTARRAAWWTAAALVPLAFGIATFGLIARVLAPDIPPGHALLTVAERGLPPWAAGWMAAALLAAMMSSASTCLLTTATILVLDLGGGDGSAEGSVARTRVAVVVVGLLATAVALWLKDIIGALLWAYGIYSGGVVVPVLFGFARERLRLTEAGALTALLVGGGIAFAGSLLHHEWALPAIAASAATLLLSGAVAALQDDRNILRR